ncbi:glycosyltransferase family 39 protein [Methylotuvimicrobium alcaliphilum]|uniref:Glycosyltransferase RgtA/B/C/D-like domain-containing protein n=1 Tax=Methylotuvimicrobium alcaliphilum (strain DSM 19304 / NCIMB 14124 / VKM B-2133 / 20Z) TaxID=1091494 RepID=G4SYW2_META2|nr:glycosyltransferase family 39 protein [Methylotuvimicrobium alcaliphilum]CCE24409.1 membrane protein of unknown function [Methylotuvimicrobium alcaliphilum 20Z]
MWRFHLARNPLTTMLVVFSIVIFFLSLILRLWLLDAWLPHYFIDENDVVEPSIVVFGGGIEPGGYGYGPLYSYLLALLHWVVSFFSRQSFVDYSINIFFDPTSYYILARTFNMTIHLATAGIVFYLAKLVFGWRTALVALPLLVFPFADLLTNYTVRVDSLLALLATATLLAAIKGYETEDLKWYLFAGVFFGLSVATKPLPAILILPTLALAHLLSQSRTLRSDESLKSNLHPKLLGKLVFKSLISKNLWYAGLAAFLAHTIANPYSLIKIKHFYWSQIRILSSEGGRGYGLGIDLTRYFGDLGVVFVIAGAASVFYILGYALVRRDARVAILLSYPVIYFLAFAFGSSREYWYIPIIFLIAVFLSKAIIDFADAFLNKDNMKSYFVFAALGAVLIQPVTILVSDAAFRQQGEQAHASLSSKKWIESHAPSGSRILIYGMAGYLPRVIDQRADVQAVFGEYFMYGRTKHQHYVDLYHVAHDTYLSMYQPTYLVTHINSNCLKDHDPKEDDLRQALDKNHYDLLVTYCDVQGLVAHNGEPIFFPYKPRRGGFNLWIYESPAPNRSMTNH